MTAAERAVRARPALSAEEEAHAGIRYKGAAQIAACAAGLVLLLAGGFLTYTDGAVNIKLGFFGAFSAMFRGGSVGYNLYGKIVRITVPGYISAIQIFSIAGFVLCMILFAVFNLLRREDRTVLGWVQIGVGALLAASYLLLLCGSFLTCPDYSGETHIFYQLYEMSVLVPAAGLLLAFCGLLQLKCPISLVPKVRKFFVFYLLLAVPTVLVLIFSVYPIFLQIILSFKQYLLGDGIWGSDWIGMGNFVFLFTDKTMLLVIWQTIYLSLLRLAAGVVPSVLFALVFFHITKLRFRSAVQTVVYIPHFFSWVVIYAIISAFLTPDGIVNNILKLMDRETIDFLARSDLFYTNMIWTSIWKEVGWGTILYMASLMGIDKTLYDAAAIDGAGVFRKLRHITFPGMMPILVFQVIMAVGSVLRGAGGEQILIFATSSVKDNKALVIDTWLYWYGLNDATYYGLSSAMSFVQSVIGFGLVIGTHKLSQRTVGIGAW